MALDVPTWTWALLAVPTPLAGKLRDLTPSELDTFQLVLDHGQLQKVLDNFPGTDLDDQSQRRAPGRICAIWVT